jgi:hypothetical protein
MDIVIPCSKRIRDLISNGVITVSVHIARDGHEVWARCTQPHPRLGLRTSTSYQLEEIEELLVKVPTKSVSFIETSDSSPHKESKRKSSIKVSPETILQRNDSGALKSFGKRPIVIPDGNTPKDLGFKDRNEALKFCGLRNLGVVVKNGVTNVLAAESLTPEDFNRPARELYARTCAITERVPASKFVSRIASSPSLTVKGSQSLADWWNMSEAPQKFILMTRSKLFPRNAKGEVHMSGSWLSKIHSLPCPFRDAETQMGQPEGGVSAEEEESYSSAEETSEMEGISLSY